MDGVLKLVKNTKTKNSKGAWATTQASREVYCKTDSVTRNEFFAGGRSGLNPQYVFTVFAADYEGETVCEYGDKPYAIYRTYLVPGTDYMELYAERKGGTNWQPEPVPDTPPGDGQGDADPEEGGEV